MPDQKRLLSTHPSNPIRGFSIHELQTNSLANIFRNGTKAVILPDQRIPQLCGQILRGMDKVPLERGRPLFINSSIFSLAQNYQRNSLLGDSIRFIPGSFAQITRRFKVFPAAGFKDMQTSPPYFIQDHTRVYYSQDLLQYVWELMTEILNSIIPLKEIPFPYSVQIEIIKYPNSDLELDNFHEILSASAGRWAKIGLNLDTWKSQNRGILKTRGINDLLAFASLFSPIKSFIQKLNLLVDNDGYKQISEKSRVLNPAHVDAGKIITCLASERDVIQTQIYDGAAWVDLPLTSNALAIFPSAEIPSSIDLKPTVHRVLLTPRDRGTPEDQPKPNATITFAIVKR
jgi:hypothetical protein